MKYRLCLKCVHCNKESTAKEYDVTEERIKEIMNIAVRALHLPQYLFCPNCRGILTVQPVVTTVN